MSKPFRTAHWTEADFIQWLETNCVSKSNGFCATKYEVVNYIFNKNQDVNHRTIKHYKLCNENEENKLKWLFNFNSFTVFEYHKEPWKDNDLRLWMKENTKH